MEQQIKRVSNKNRKDLVFNERNSLSKTIERMPIVSDYHPPLLDLLSITTLVNSSNK